MQARSTWFLCLILAGCGGSTAADDDPIVTDAGADGTADAAKDGAIDSALPDVHSGDALLVSDSTDAADASCASCIAAKLSWGQDGGRVAYVDTASITACRTFEHRRTAVLTDPADQVCTQEMAACPAGAHDIAHVVDALRNADVVAALAKAPVLYGHDTRPTDGSVLVVTYDGKQLTIGGDCAGASDCTPVPAGVASLVELLQAVDTDQLAIGVCKTTFKP